MSIKCLYNTVQKCWQCASYSIQLVLGPGNASPSATNVLVVVLGLVSPKSFSFHNQSSSNFAYRFV